MVEDMVDQADSVGAINKDERKNEGRFQLQLCWERRGSHSRMICGLHQIGVRVAHFLTSYTSSRRCVRVCASDFYNKPSNSNLHLFSSTAHVEQSTLHNQISGLPRTSSGPNFTPARKYRAGGPCMWEMLLTAIE